MYVSATSRRFSRGRFTPAIRAKLFSLPLALLVPRIRADDQNTTVPLDHAAAVAHRLDGRTHFHQKRTRSHAETRRSRDATMVPETGFRTGSAKTVPRRLSPGPRSGF